MRKGRVSRMRILHLLSQKPEGTGSGVTVQSLMREARKKGHETYLLAGVDAGEGIPPAESADSCSVVEFGTDALPFAVVGMSDVMPYPSTRFCDLSASTIAHYENCFKEKMLEAVRYFKPHLIHSHHLWILTSLARKTIIDIPIAASCHGSDLRQFHLCPSLRERVLSGCSSIDGVLVLSSAQKREVRQLYGIPEERLEITGIGFDESLFRSGEKSRGGEVHILYAGKLSRAKGVVWLLDALESIQHLPWHFHIAGSGTGQEAEEVREAASRLAQRVTLHGALPQPRLAGLMAKAHIFVLPSFYEGFPLVLVEALACGCRLIASALPGVKEIFSQGKLGSMLRLVAMPSMSGPDTPVESDLPDFVERLKVALISQIAGIRSKEALSGSEIADFLGNYTWEKVFERVEKVYQRVST
jgi:glycosyltransferase involved in cell wall biosynthesis